MEWDVTCYAEMLPKKPSKSGTKASNEKEASLRWWYPLLNGDTASLPCIIVDMQGIILAWYLSGILTDSRQVGLFALSDSNGKPDANQNSMLVAREKLRLLLEKLLHCSSTWHNDLKNFHPGEGLQGSVNLSPAWFQQGHDVSASSCRIHFLAAHDSKSGNGAKISTGFC